MCTYLYIDVISILRVYCTRKINEKKSLIALAIYFFDKIAALSLIVSMFDPNLDKLIYGTIDGAIMILSALDYIISHYKH
jgi:hypothetical protein